MDIRLEAALRGWRLVEARRLGVQHSESSATELLAVPGIGSSTVAKYETMICRVLRDNGG